MSQDTKTMRVSEVPGERFRYLVESTSEPGMAHTVDLAQSDGLGSCTCANYDYRIFPVQRKGEYIEWRPKRKGCSECRHIYASRRHYITKHLLPFMGSFEYGDPKDIATEIKKLLGWKEQKPTTTKP